jgi:hypothetical protein
LCIIYSNNKFQIGKVWSKTAFSLAAHWELTGSSQGACCSYGYVCQTDKLLAKYVKIAEVDSGHILELDKTMENMRFMTNMNYQYTNKSDNKEDGNDDVEDIDPGDKLVNYFNNGNNYYNDDDNDDEEDDDDNNRDSGNDDNGHGNANKGGRQFVASCLSGSDC